MTRSIKDENDFSKCEKSGGQKRVVSGPYTRITVFSKFLDLILHVCVYIRENERESVCVCVGKVWVSLVL